MRRVYHFLLTLPDECSRLTLHQLLLLAAMATLTISVILMMSGRETA